MQVIPYTKETFDTIKDNTKNYLERYMFFKKLEMMVESERRKAENEKTKQWYEKNKDLLEETRKLRNKEIELIKEKKEFKEFQSKLEDKSIKYGTRFYISWDFFLCEDTEGTSHIPPLEDLTMTFGSDEYNKKYKELLNKIDS